MSSIVKETSEPTLSSVVEKQFSFLKNTFTYQDLLLKGMPLGDGMGWLIPVAYFHCDDVSTIQLFAKWREETAFAFPTRFPVTFEGTKKWLKERLLDVKERMLFLVLDRFGKPVGHLGFSGPDDATGTIEIDNVVRGDNTAPKGIMSAAMSRLMLWAQEILFVDGFYLRVLYDNGHAIQFYEKNGFAQSGLVPLKKIASGPSISYVPLENRGEAADSYFVRMERAAQKPLPELILTAGPSISAMEVSFVVDAARTGWNQNWDRYLKEFEKRFADFLGVKHCLSTSSCTGALHIALIALGIGPGDEVIVPAITWVATANAVAYVGATPVFADVEPDSWCLDAHSVESVITPKTKVIIPVHLYGHPARMDRIMALAERHHLRIVEDAAPAIGAKYRGQKVGTFGDFSAFSFQGAKLVVTGEGGMLATNDTALYEKAKLYWDQGRVPGTFWINETGVKYKMSNMTAAFGLGQLLRTPEFIAAKRKIYSWYEEGLSKVPGIRLMKEIDEASSIYWMTNILVTEDYPLNRDELRKQLKEKCKIDTRPVFPDISQYPMWKTAHHHPNARTISERGINLPSGVCLSRSEIDHVCHAIKLLGQNG